MTLPVPSLLAEVPFWVQQRRHTSFIQGARETQAVGGRLPLPRPPRGDAGEEFPRGAHCRMERGALASVTVLATAAPFAAHEHQPQICKSGVRSRHSAPLTVEHSQVGLRDPVLLLKGTSQPPRRGTCSLPEAHEEHARALRPRAPGLLKPR